MALLARKVGAEVGCGVEGWLGHKQRRASQRVGGGGWERGALDFDLALVFGFDAIVFAIHACGVSYIKCPNNVELGLDADWGAGG